MDLYNENKNFQMRTYEYNISPYKMTKEFSAHVFNGYLAFSSTVYDSKFFSIFMIFGFANGTDFIINISPYLMDNGQYNEENNLVKRLLQSLKIDNNIFGYILVEQIKLVSYPIEIIFHSEDENTHLPNGTIIDINYKLKQNWRVNKTSQYYYIDYQYLIKEQDYNSYESFANNIYEIEASNIYKYENVFSPKTYFGRTNRLFFKLCHDYCETCN